MPRTTMAAQIAALTSLVETLSAQIANAPAAPLKASQYDVRGGACTAVPACARTDIKSVARRGVHGIEKGHTARTAEQIAAIK